jgi:hypothetical protein
MRDDLIRTLPVRAVMFPGEACIASITERYVIGIALGPIWEWQSAATVVADVDEKISKDAPRA